MALFITLLVCCFPLFSWKNDVTVPKELLQQNITTSRKISINLDDPLWFETLPGIGPKIAKSIAKKRPFQKPDDLLILKGIGTERLKKLLPFIHFD